MWTFVLVVNEIETAKNIKKNLERASLKVRVKKRNSEESEPGTFEILVPCAEVTLALAQVG